MPPRSHLGSVTSLSRLRDDFVRFEFRRFSLSYSDNGVIRTKNFRWQQYTVLFTCVLRRTILGVSVGTSLLTHSLTQWKRIVILANLPRTAASPIRTIAGRIRKILRPSTGRTEQRIS